MHFNDVMRELAEKIGVGPLQFDDNGSVAMLFDNEHEITFTPNPDDCSVLFHAELGPAPLHDGKACLKLLTASLLGAQTGGTAIAVHEALGNVVLWKRHDENFADCAALEQAINRFLAQVISWKKQLGHAPHVDDAEAGLPSGFHLKA
ncbi:MAG: type III secretion system chaperone [Desulfovibrio sp.]|nr:type III secretion system chaperone [Desulfovibrio sp.]